MWKATLSQSVRRCGPEVVDLEFKMRCFGVFAAQNSKKLCFSLQKQQHEAGIGHLWKQWESSGGIEEREGEEQEQEQEQINMAEKRSSTQRKHRGGQEAEGKTES